MGANTKIEWADHTFSPWWGCTRVSEACRFCYAESWAKRWGTGWGPEADRRFFPDKHWNEPRKWNRKAERDSVRRRVFCASMADVFEKREDLVEHRERLWKLIDETPHLIWMLLTKRPENILEMIPQAWIKKAPATVWYGTTIEENKHVIDRIDALANVPAIVRFLSCEPMIGPLELGLAGTRPKTWRMGYGPVADAIHWVIAGGESGPKARPMNPEWPGALQRECAEFDVPFLFKQWGEHDCSGSRVGKKAAGRALFGSTYDETPEYEGKEIASV